MEQREDYHTKPRKPADKGDQQARLILDAIHTAETLQAGARHTLNAYVYLAHRRGQERPVPPAVWVRVSEQPEDAVDNGLATYDLELVHTVRSRFSVHRDALGWLARLVGRPVEQVDV